MGVKQRLARTTQGVIDGQLDWLDECRIIGQAAKVLHEAVNKLHFRGSKLRDILRDAVEVNRLENEADQIFSRAMGELFSNGISPIEVLKWREIYGQLEAATDHCEDAANVLEGVVLKNA